MIDFLRFQNDARRLSGLGESGACSFSLPFPDGEGSLLPNRLIESPRDRRRFRSLSVVDTARILPELLTRRTTFWTGDSGMGGGGVLNATLLISVDGREGDAWGITCGRPSPSAA